MPPSKAVDVDLITGELPDNPYLVIIYKKNRSIKKKLVNRGNCCHFEAIVLSLPCLEQTITITLYRSTILIRADKAQPFRSSRFRNSELNS